MSIKKIHFFVSSKYLVKRLHKLSYSILSITLSCKDFLYNLSKHVFLLLIFFELLFVFIVFVYD